MVRNAAVLDRWPRKKPLPTIDEMLGIKPIVKRQSAAEMKSVFAAMREAASASVSDATA